MTDPKELFIQKAKALGFGWVRFARADKLETEAIFLEEWLQKNMHGEMSWLENYFDLRIDPRALVPGAKTVICLACNYFPHEEDLPVQSSIKISKYAYGRDYHKVIKKKLKSLAAFMTDSLGSLDLRVFVDSGPVMEKAWARRSGIGWMGKHTNMIHPKHGSYFFLSVLITDYSFEPDPPLKDACGRCTLCVDACPTGALDVPYQIDASKCISYATIELKGEIPSLFENKMDHWVYGCDICQDVCPWTRKSTPHSEPDFRVTKGWNRWSEQEWKELTEEVFDQLFQGSAVKRSGYKGLMRNIRMLALPEEENNSEENKTML